MATRKCDACGEDKPLNGDHFPRDPGHGAGGYRRSCLLCYNARRRKAHAGVAPAKPPKIEVVEEKITQLEEHRLKKQVKDLAAKNKELVADLADASNFQALVTEILSKQNERRAPVIAPRERKSGLREGTPLILASDWHVEEEVTHAQTAGRNRYNLDISAKRMTNFFEATRWTINHQREAFKIRDLILWMGGDFMTNFLHEDDVENNLLAPMETVLYLYDSWCTGIDLLLEDPEIEQAIIPMNDGNHGRVTKKMRSATRSKHSLEVLLYCMLAKKYKDEPRLRFIIPTSAFTFLDDVYGRTIRFLHGDVFKYGGGIGGITVPLFRALGRWEKVKHADLTCMGHWHQRICLPDCMVNGSLIGYNAYAMSGGFPFEPPVQSLRMLDSKRWGSVDVPLYVADREDDLSNRRRAA